MRLSREEQYRYEQHRNEEAEHSHPRQRKCQGQRHQSSRQHMNVTTSDISKLAHSNETQPDTTWDQHFENARKVVSVDQRTTDHVYGGVLVAEYPTRGDKILEQAEERFQDADAGHGS